MISLLCQKNNSGKITPGDKDLYKFLVLEGATTTNNNNNNNNNNSNTSNSNDLNSNLASAFKENNSSYLLSNHNSQKFNELDSSFLKKFPKTKVKGFFCFLNLRNYFKIKFS